MIVEDVAKRDKERAAKLIGLISGGLLLAFICAALGLYYYRNAKKGTDETEGSELSDETDIGNVASDQTRVSLDIEEPDLITKDTEMDEDDQFMNNVDF